jgi:hypothetical protein
MNYRLLGWLAIITLIFSVLWLVFLVAGIITAGPLDTLDQAIAYAAHQRVLFVLTYLNAALVTLACTVFMVGLYRFVRESIPIGGLVGLLFVPVYTTINLVVYLSQIAVIPQVIRQYATEMGAAGGAMTSAKLLLSLLLQAWPQSGMAFFNNLAYGILGIPSILFGMVLWRSSFPLRYGGGLLTLNGVVCLLGVVGLLTGSAFLSLGSLVGGVLFILALPFIASGMLRKIA